METIEDRQRRREIRGSILRTLDVFYGRTPATATLRTIQRSLRDVAQEAIEQEMAYLVDLSYVARIADKRDSLDEDPPVVYRLLPQGKKVLNGDLEDRSIEV